MLTFKCLRCGRTVGARQAVITQDASEVVYSCPHDGGRFATVHTQHGSVFSYDFSDAELAIRVQGSDVAWWDFVNGGGDDATTV
jgi:DNA-directed RNA polymerase subunit RPC12/RpoP